MQPRTAADYARNRTPALKRCIIYYYYILFGVYIYLISRIYSIMSDVYNTG